MIRLLRFATVGLANTAISFAIILTGLWAGWGDYLANAAGYAAGLAFSYGANRQWTFERAGTRPDAGEAGRFLLSALLAYGVNLSIIMVARCGGLIDNPMSHIMGAFGYTIASFTLQRFFVFPVQTPPTPKSSAPLSALWPEGALSLVALLAWWSIHDIPLTHDVVWQFWIARQMLGGAKLYHDIWELNPPLWFWSAIPVTSLGNLTGIAPLHLLIAIVVIWGTCSALLLGRLADIASPMSRFLLMLGAFWFATLMPLYDFGQREQLALMGSIPYAALISRRRSDRDIPLPIALATGLLASYGFALKHYFVLVPVLLEIWLVLGLRGGWKALRPETATLAGAAIIYAVAVPLFAPDFLTTIVPMVRSAYYGYEQPLARLIDEPAQIIWLLSFVALLLYRRLFGRHAVHLATAFLIAAAAFCVAYVAQHKGWQYHAIPVTGLLLMALLARMLADGASQLWRRPLGIAIVAFAIWIGIAQKSYFNFLERGDDAQINAVPTGEPIAIIASDPMWTWPMVEDRKLVWPLHLYSYWMLSAIGEDALGIRRAPNIEGLSETVKRQTLFDLQCNPPQTIMIQQPLAHHSYNGRRFDVQRWLLAERDIALFLRRHYRQEADTSFFHVYRRLAPIQARPAHGCWRPTARPS